MAKSTTRGRGNTQLDEDFLEWMRLTENGGLRILDPEIEDIPFPAKLKWAGSADDESPWKVPPPGKRCVASAFIRDMDGDYILDEDNNRLTRPCWRWPIRGTTVCLVHGGGVTRVKKAAIERMALALDAVTGALVKIALTEDVSPKDRISAINSIMDRVGVRGGTEIDVNNPGYLDVLKGLFESRPGDPDDEDDEDEDEAPVPAKKVPTPKAKRSSRKTSGSDFGRG